MLYWVMLQLGSRVVSVQMHTRDAFEAIEDRSLDLERNEKQN